ncbi:tyrosyl-DNA phosphodiesterase, partial [Saitoella complicata NRRL Y-17804]|uniref:tyrosyl-DNA phosphodiesterase n=1 Tax=Saitoella complicata (strain BCRC 22490 / CBS 7301 / JCM 7358 / NBRC 10748 / NRRL Y-17804) TaxID=698492 RepID=UPI00086724A4
LPPSENVDTITLFDILSGPLISCTWQFNFLFDIPFIYSHFDPDTADACCIKIVHGFWKTEDPTRHTLYEEAERYKNVELIAAYLPDPFGTHHTKMMVVFRRDDTVQVVVHTANMIEKDWGNMTNAAWLSPPLPFKIAASPATSEFEVDIMAYFAAYGRDRLKALMEEVKKYDFSSVKVTFVASVPGKFTTTSTKRMWGIERMRDVLSQAPSTPDTPSSKDTIIGQFSSIGSLGPKDTWLGPYFHSALSTTSSSTPSSRKPPLKLIFPTPSSIKNSLEGWFSGGSIHLRLSTPQMQSQLEYMRPMLCDWHAVEAGRERAAPHIKTYMRLSEDEKSGVRVKWALLTSANLSKPAWGTPVAGRDPGFKIQSYEAGILIHPAQYTSSNTEIVPLRMPWDWPLKKYEKADEPWTPGPARMEVDWRGMPW